MPRNRQDVERATKVADIRAAAVGILRDGGYDALSHTAVARRLGLARTAIYWYFPTKDDLFAAAMADIYAEDLGTAPNRGDLLARLKYAVNRLAAVQPLTHIVHERARHSEPVAALEKAFHEELCGRLRAVLADRVTPDKLDVVTNTIIVFVEGLLTQQRSTEERLDLLGFLVAQLIHDDD